MTQGRTPPPLQELTLSSGVTVKIRKVSPYTIEAVRKQFKAPRPPMVANDFGNGETRMEPNPADPDYLQAFVEHQALVVEKVTEATLHLGVEVEIDHAALDAFKADMAAMGVELSGSDKQLYLRHLVMVTDEDIDRLSTAVLRKNTPTAEAVQEHLDTFQGDVSGSGSDGDRAAQVRD